MSILLPIIFMFTTALLLLGLRLTQSRFKYPWVLAAGGATLALGSVFLWQIHFPQSISLPSWQLVTAFLFVPAWLADGVSWPYAIALAALAAAVIWTSVVRSENDPLSWAGTLALTGFGTLAVASENPLTLLLAWSAIDIFELITTLRSTEGEEQIRGAIIAFSVRLAGTGLVLWADLVGVSSGTPLDFRAIPPGAGIILLIAAGLRLGVLPMHLPYRTDNVVRRGFGTALRLVSAASSLALLSRIQASALNSALIPYLFILAALAALYAGWMWLRSSDEVLGRPFWIMGFASLAVAASLRGNPSGSIGWGVALILCGTVLFLFSARRKSILWLPILGLWALSGLPFSLTAAGWQSGNTTSWLFIIPFLLAQALMMAGFLRHTLHPGETSLESQEKWVKVIYPTGLLIPLMVAIMLGFGGWVGAQTIGPWWLAIIVAIFTTGFFYLAARFLVQISPGSASNQWTEVFRLERVYSFLGVLYNVFSRIADVITGSLEGDGGLLWSFLLLVLLLSILSTRGR